MPSLEIMLLAGRAVFLVFSFVVAAIAFVQWRRSTQRGTENMLQQMGSLSQRLAQTEQSLIALDERFARLTQRLEEERQPASPAVACAASYRIGIRLARGGASRDELIESCGLTRQEADLLQRLHGPGDRDTRGRYAAA